MDPIYRSTINRDVPPARPGEFQPVGIGPLRVWPPVVLAPMAGVTNYPFRSICRRFGAGLYVSEMITARPLVEGNRGVIEYNDLFKRPMDANKYLLSTSERGTVTLDIGRMQLDAVLVATANETYLEAFKQQPDWSSYKGRFELVRMPYLLDYTAEQGIYDDLLATLELPCPVAPHTTFSVALWAVLTRLHQPNPDRYPQSIREVIAAMSPLQKARLYADGTVPDGLTLVSATVGFFARPCTVVGRDVTCRIASIARLNWLTP